MTPVLVEVGKNINTVVENELGFLNILIEFLTILSYKYCDDQTVMSVKSRAGERRTEDEH